MLQMKKPTAGRSQNKSINRNDATVCPYKTPKIRVNKREHRTIRVVGVFFPSILNLLKLIYIFLCPLIK